jgi:hypothetical protein
MNTNPHESNLPKSVSSAVFTFANFVFSGGKTSVFPFRVFGVFRKAPSKAWWFLLTATC